MTRTSLNPFVQLLVVCSALLAGCAHQQPGTWSHASVQITGVRLSEIQKTTTDVFAAQGYRLSAKGPELMVFDRPGSAMDKLKYGGWFDEGVDERVKISFRDMGPSGFMLQADVYAVRNAGDTFFEDENHNVILNNHPYQNLLNEVQKRMVKVE